ncbi:Gfo/Idh/MocA family protein [Streptomyces bohaiensis]|uniref:Gfo/Idh/MocA family oxidoreductase n=1 Tax=Streptomyces bohaiensis TaxID=1431344 RepID=A0ABX1CIA1_9ACTN|nr:Gfo/Idh/MocA family oxidoreductase [Streptomyces bohaiensis]NJQ16897.1 Gfo/Idh/MocA family oxidoreductase [Streptomyces bohaiensis]
MRIGLLGTGPWARRTHGPALAAHPAVELAGVWGRRPEAARDLADTLGTRAHDDVDALLDACDAVAIALPPDVQAPLAVRAARAGKHLLLDKPIATSVEGARELVDVVAETGVASVVYFTLRFTDGPAAWVEEQRAADGWWTGDARWLSSIFAGGDSPYAASPWRHDRGALWDVGPHALSMLLPVLGDVADLETVCGQAGPGDTVQFLLRHTSGAVSTVTTSHTVPEAAAEVLAEVRGEAGVSRMPAWHGDAPAVPFANAVDALLRAAGGEPHPCDVRFGARVTEILAAVEASLPAKPARSASA